MPDLADIYHVYGGDLSVTPSGDIAVAVKQDRTEQRIIRRLLTAATQGNGSSYPWEPDYGVGLGAKVGAALDGLGLQGTVLAQMLAEPTVQKIPAPVVTVTKIVNGAAIDITYTDISGVPRSFGFDLV